MILLLGLINRLQDKFPNTAPTVVRTGLKISLPPSLLTKRSDVHETINGGSVMDISDDRKEEKSGIVEKKWGGRKGRKGESLKLPGDIVLCPICSR